MQNLIDVLDFLKSVTLLTVGQLLSISGVLFVFGLILYLLARMTRRVYAKSAGSTIDVILTGWIGTPVHEIGHAVFCLIFFHKIEKIKLFDPNQKDGSLGYVIHSYNRKNIWQRIGNFFIGVGPVVFGSVILYAAMYFLVPGFRNVFLEIEKHAITISSVELDNWQFAYHALLDSIKITLNGLITTSNFTAWQFWLFVYLSMCIASHMELSPADLKSALGGFIILAMVVFIYNLVILILEMIGLGDFAGGFWKYLDIRTYKSSLAGVTGLATAIFVYAGIISALNFLISWLLMSFYNLIRNRKIINPLWG